MSHQDASPARNIPESISSATERSRPRPKQQQERVPEVQNHCSGTWYRLACPPPTQIEIEAAQKPTWTIWCRRTDDTWAMSQHEHWQQVTTFPKGKSAYNSTGTCLLGSCQENHNRSWQFVVWFGWMSPSRAHGRTETGSFLFKKTVNHRIYIHPPATTLVKKCLASVWACERFGRYLIVLENFNLCSDHKPLVLLNNSKDISRTTLKCQRMLIRLMRYKLMAKHRPRKRMITLDTLSQSHTACRDMKSNRLSCQYWAFL